MCTDITKISRAEVLEAGPDICTGRSRYFCVHLQLLRSRAGLLSSEIPKHVQLSHPVDLSRTLHPTFERFRKCWTIHSCRCRHPVPATEFCIRDLTKSRLSNHARPRCAQPARFRKRQSAVQHGAEGSATGHEQFPDVMHAKIFSKSGHLNRYRFAIRLITTVYAGHPAR